LPKPANTASICASHVAGEVERGAELRGKALDALLEALALVGEGQFGTLAVAGFRNPVRDRAVAQHPGHQNFLAGEETHLHTPLIVLTGADYIG